MRRAYVDVSHFRSPYDSPTLSLSGLGALHRNWPVGRSYVDVAHFRAPYDQGYFQDNDLFGLGADAAPVPVAVLPEPGALDLALGLVSLFAGTALLGFGLGVGWHAAKKLAGAGA